MSLNNVGLRKSLKDFFFFNNKEYNLDDYSNKQARCDDLFDEFKDCVARHGWNDNVCQVTQKAKYDRCVIKRDKIKI